MTFEYLNFGYVELEIRTKLQGNKRKREGVVNMQRDAHSRLIWIMKHRIKPKKEDFETSNKT